MATASARFAGRSVVPSWQDAAGKWVLLLHLVLSPLLFCTHTAEAFEGPKVWLLSAAALTLAALAASAWLSRGAGAPRPRLSLDLTTLGLLLFTASAALSTLFSLSPLISWRGAPESRAGLQTLLGYLILYLATRRLCHTAEDGRRLLAAVVVASAVSSAYALIQAARLDPYVWGDASTDAAHLRPFATLGHANLLSAYLVTAAPLLALFLLQALLRRRWGAALTLALIGALAGAALVAALSRAAWVAGGCAILALAFGWFLAGARRAALTLAGLTGLVVAVALWWGLGGSAGAGLAGRVGERLRRIDDAEGRWQIWRASWALFRDRPLTGWGPDALQLAFGSRRPADFVDVEGDNTPTRAHNVALHILATQGAPGAGAAAVLLVGLVGAGVRAWRRSAPVDRPLVAAVAAGLLAFLVQDLFGFAVIGCGALFVTGAALLSRWAEPMADAGPSSGPSRGLLAGLLAGGGLAVAVFAFNVGWSGAGATAGLAASAVLSAAAVWRACPPLVPLVPTQSVGTRRRTAWTVAPHVGIGVAAVAALYMGVVRPAQASLACGEGDGIPAAPREALACYARAVALDPYDDGCWAKLSGAAQLASRQASSPEEQQSLLGQARAALERAVALVPASPYNHANLGRLLGEMTSDGTAGGDEAIREWDAALAADPLNAPLLMEAARTALAVGRRDRARLWAARGAEFYPQYSLFQVQKALCDFAEGRVEDAANTLNGALRADWHGEPDDLTRALAAFAAVQLARGDFEQSQLLAGYASDRNPGWAAPCLIRARAFQALGRKDEARRAYRRLLTLDPTRTDARTALRQLEVDP